MGSNIIQLRNHTVPSYQRPRTPAARAAQAPAANPAESGRPSWTTMARQRAAQKWGARLEHGAHAEVPSAAPMANDGAAQPPWPVRAATMPNAGAVRLSGRLADVCAELERLAAAEAAQIAA